MQSAGNIKAEKRKRLVQFRLVKCHCNNTTAQCEVQIIGQYHIEHHRAPVISANTDCTMQEWLRGGRRLHASLRQINAALIYCIYIETVGKSETDSEKWT